MSELIEVKFEETDGDIYKITANGDYMCISPASFEDIWLYKKDLPKLIDALQTFQRKIENEANG